jgi:hypothetical protein
MEAECFFTELIGYVHLLGVAPDSHIKFTEELVRESSWIFF